VDGGCDAESDEAEQLDLRLYEDGAGGYQERLEEVQENEPVADDLSRQAPRHGDLYESPEQPSEASEPGGWPASQ
jgi:hypothetical protein